MADKNTYLQLSQSVQHLSFLKELPETSDDEKAELESYLQDLASQQERKFDSIIGLLKKCDHYIDAYDKELAELKMLVTLGNVTVKKLLVLLSMHFNRI